MITLTRVLYASLRSRQRRWLAAERALAALLTFALLLIPATCANAAGPHSIYIDPTASHAHHHATHQDHHEGDAAPMSQAELELHVLLEQFTPGEATASSSVEQVNGDAPCDRGVRLKDLPSSMAMAAATNPVVLGADLWLELPVATEPVSGDPDAPVVVVSSPELPPPR